MSDFSRPVDAPEPDPVPPLPFREAFDMGRALSTGVAAFRRAVVPLWLGGLLMWITEGSGCNLPNPADFEGIDNLDFEGAEEGEGGATWGNALRQPFEDAGGLGSDTLPWVVGLSIAFIVCLLALFVGLLLVRAYIHPGYIRLHHHVLQTAEPAFKPLFSGADRFWHMLLWKLLSGGMLFLAFVLPALPGALMLGFTLQADVSSAGRIAGSFAMMAALALPVLVYVGLGVSLGAHAITLEGRTPLDALKRSWSLVRGNRLWLLLFYVVLLLFELLGLLGVILCCVGVLFTYPMTRSIANVGVTESFLLLTRGRSVEGYWALRDLEGRPGAADASPPSPSPRPPPPASTPPASTPPASTPPASTPEGSE